MGRCRRIAEYYGQDDVAMEITGAFNNVRHTYVARKTGRKTADVNVPEPAVAASEYPLQDGFGWTSGVTLKNARSDLFAENRAIAYRLLVGIVKSATPTKHDLQRRGNACLW